MDIEYHDRFIKHYAKRIRPRPVLHRASVKRLKVFLNNPKHPLLRDHALTGDLLGFRAFWITGDIRIVYKKIGNTIQLYDIGTHAQVYG